MTSNILSIGKSGLYAAQVGIDTTGHNIANVNVEGYSRQTVLQQASLATTAGFGYIGTGTQISSIKRVYSSFLDNQVLNSQSSSSSLNNNLTQISQIDNMLADSTSGLTPALQGFFASVQDLSTSPTDARQSLMSSGESLAARFQSLNSQLQTMRDGVNSEVTSSVTSINSISAQIATLNKSIVAASAGSNNPPNDLLDKRDQLVAQLSKFTAVAVGRQPDSSYNISIGNGLPLVMGSQSYQLAAIASSTDPTRIEIGYVTGGKVSSLSDTALSGGSLGGLLDFRTNSLDASQNALGRIAITLADKFNEQHKLGIDANGDPGGAFFNEAAPLVSAGVNNDTGSTAVATATISDSSALTNSDYKVRYEGSPPQYTITAVPDGHAVPLGQSPIATTIGGVDIAINGTSTVGDEFMIRPTIEGAAMFTMAISDRTQIAAAAPIVTSAATGNTGSGAISAGSVSTGFTSASVTPSVKMTYDSTADAFNFDFGSGPVQNVTVTANGAAVAGSPFTPPAQVPYTPGATISFGNVNFQMNGTPGNGDSFTIGPNISGVGDNRNALLLMALQTQKTMESTNGQPTATFQSAYASLVSDIGNTTSELKVTAAAGDTLLASNKAAVQSVSGVNLDEEAANLIRYQQAYQASGKVMQTATQMFNTLLSIGG
jgi:flagellar hook-associated protein 1 FlgK